MSRWPFLLKHLSFSPVNPFDSFLTWRESTDPTISNSLDHYTNLRILDVIEVKTVPYVPLSHPFVERLIGTVRREYLDQVPFWSARDLERKLVSFQDYYNKDRVHRGLNRAPAYEIIANTDHKIARLDDYRWRKRCRGLYQLPVAA